MIHHNTTVQWLKQSYVRHGRTIIPPALPRAHTARRRLITPYFGISVSCYEPPKTVNISHRDVVVPRVRWAGCLENMTMALTIGFLRRIWPNKIQQ